MAVGLPREGKTYSVVEELKRYKHGTLYINPKKLKSKSPFTVVDKRNTLSQIVNGVRAGMHLEYRLNGADALSAGELEYIIDGLLDAGIPESRPVLLAIDEIHYFKGKGASKVQNKIEELSAVGVSLGVSSIFISQRFATIPYTAVALCENLYFFRMGHMEKDYMVSKKLPYDEIMKRIDQKGKYSYCVMDSREGLKGAFKE